jgi:hypothetical protein
VLTVLQNPESVLRAWYELVGNQGCEGAIDKLLTEEGMTHGLRGAEGNTARGPASFKHIFRTFRTAFPDLRITLDEVISPRDICVARCTIMHAQLQ